MSTAVLFWTSLNTALSVLLSVILAHKLVNWHDQFNWPERVGMGVLAGSILLTIPVLWALGPTPFDYWSTALTRVGAVVYFLGRLSRHMDHWRRNDAMKGQARGNLRG